MSELPRVRLSPDRIKAFVDGVVAIIITIMVLELKVPEADLGAGETSRFFADLERQLHPYLASFLHVVERKNDQIGHSVTPLFLNRRSRMTI